jgi:hypothetical protein
MAVVVPGNDLLPTGPEVPSHPICDGSLNGADEERVWARPLRLVTKLFKIRYSEARFVRIASRGSRVRLRAFDSGRNLLLVGES